MIARFKRYLLGAPRHVHQFGPWSKYGNLTNNETVIGLVQQRTCLDETCRYVDLDSQDVR